MSTHSIHRWPAQQRVRHGGSVAEMLPPEIEGCERIVLVTTRSLADSAIAAATRAAIGNRLVAETARMGAHSPIPDVMALAALLREHRADRVVALGGGSVIDGSKVACYAVWHGLADQAALLPHVASRAAEGDPWEDVPRVPRITAIPTTLSAAEFAPYAGVTDK
ncbi:MAG: iron-containing alcohol dehydrogenase, partial [Acetobacteraceae bacterium]|nr:iron-containing alcohol dehydrogenase [Acetobacteraceae bacterium]